MVIQKFIFKNIDKYNFAVILYGCGNWSLTLRMERKQGVSKYRALRRKLGDKRDEDNFEWSKLHSD